MFDGLMKELDRMARGGRWDGFAAWHDRARAAVDAAGGNGAPEALYRLRNDLAELSRLYSQRDYDALRDAAGQLARRGS